VRDVLRIFLAAVAAGDNARAERAALALDRLGDTALPPLRDLLAAVSADRRWWAVRGLAAVGTAAARELLVVVLEDADAGVRACAAQGLGERRAVEAVPALARHLDDPDSLVSRIASDGLARIGRPAVQTLIATLREGSTLARLGAARALSIICPGEAIPALCAALDDPSAVVAHYAETALERMGVGLALFRP
jgi:HEAT repeat protein